MAAVSAWPYMKLVCNTLERVLLQHQLMSNDVKVQTVSLTSLLVQYRTYFIYITNPNTFIINCVNKYSRSNLRHHYHSKSVFFIMGSQTMVILRLAAVFLWLFGHLRHNVTHFSLFTSQLHPFTMLWGMRWDDEMHVCIMTPQEIWDGAERQTSESWLWCCGGFLPLSPNIELKK